MLAVSFMNFIFNLIQVKILHMGSSHYEFGEEVDLIEKSDQQHHTSQVKEKNQIRDEEVKIGLLENEQGHQTENEIQERRPQNHPLDTSFLAVFCNLLMSLLLIGLSASIFCMPELAAKGDLLFVCAYALMLACATIPAFKDTILVMMEGTPKHINMESLRKDIELECGDDLHGIHDLHVWIISHGHVATTCHLRSIKPLKTLA